MKATAIAYARHPDSPTPLIALHELKMASPNSQPARIPNSLNADKSPQTKEDQSFRAVKARTIKLCGQATPADCATTEIIP